jgi:N-acetylglucosamine-6-phosphate deacetylase
MLVTDSMAATELSDGVYDLGGQPVYVREGQARLEAGSLAGSTLTLDRAVRNVVELCGVPLHDALYMDAAVPATAIGLGDRKGQIRAGYDADLAFLDETLHPVRTLVAGNVIWAR